jgi:SAM-dependent methyltransferase
MGHENGNWYYTVELAPGEHTAGHRHANVAATRALLRGVDLASTSCLDIGTQEAMLPVLMKRAGAAYVAAYDRLDLGERIGKVKRAYAVEFDYIGGRRLADLPAELEARSRRVVDVVVFSGVMYHMINPLGGLATARSFCRAGGVFLIETAAMQSREMALHFNAEGRLYGSHANFFVPTTACLDYFLRMLGLRPLRGAYIGAAADGSVNRVAVLCRGEPRAVPLSPGDDWCGEANVMSNFADDASLQWDRLASAAPPVRLHPAPAPDSVIGEGRSLYDWIRAAPAYSPRPGETALALDSVL